MSFACTASQSSRPTSLLKSYPFPWTMFFLKSAGAGIPSALSKKKGLLQQDATDGVIVMGREGFSSVLFDARSHRVIRRSAVFLAERVPCEARGRLNEPSEETAACDVIFRMVQFKQKGITDIQASETAPAARLPEAHLIYVRSGAQKRVPIPVRDSDERLHPLPTKVRCSTFSKCT